MIHNKDIICISSIDWDFIWQGHQEIMTILAGQGNRVLFIENTGVRPPTLRDLPRLRKRIRNWSRGTKGFRREKENLFIYSPLILPFPYLLIARYVNRFLLIRSIRRWMRAMGFSRPIVWTFLPTPLARDLIYELNPEITVYYCIDDLPSSSPPARKIGKSEALVFREADIVFVTSEKLRQRAALFNDHVHFFPFGVSYRKFEKVRESSDEVPEDLSKLSRPLVGYVGGIHQWVDQQLLADVADRMPDTSFALIGPSQVDVSRLARCPNVYLLGARSHTDVPCYIKFFDVGLIPYRLSEYTSNVYPTKLNEYLAMGIPVVATNLIEIQRFNAEHKDIVKVANDPEELEIAICEAIKETTPEEFSRRIEVARQNSWESRITRMADFIEERIASRRITRQQWEVTLRQLYRGSRRRIFQTIIGVGVFYLLIFYSPLVWFLAAPLRIEEKPKPVDAIVVFAGGVGESGKAGQGYQERVKYAVELYNKGYANYLIFSSGYSFKFIEVEIMKALAISMNVPANVIILENKARNTYENVKFTNIILKKNSLRSILVISSPYHMLRVSLVYSKIGNEFKVLYVPIPESRFYSHGLTVSLEQVNGIMREYLGILFYWYKGWI